MSSKSNRFLCCFRKKKKPNLVQYELYQSNKGKLNSKVIEDRSISLRENFIIGNIVFEADFQRTYEALSLHTRTNCILHEHLLDLRNNSLNFRKLFCIESMLDEFSSSEICPFLEPYLDYRVIKKKKFYIIEIAYENTGINLKDMTKFEKAIIFKDFRDILVTILMTLSFLKARVVRDTKWLGTQNIKFDLDNFHPILSNYVRIDVAKSSDFNLINKKVDLLDIEGEKGKFYLES